MDANEGISGVRLMDDLKESRLYRWMGTGSICLTMNMYVSSCLCGGGREILRTLSRTDGVPWGTWRNNLGSKDKLEVALAE
jgi:hypothetical protein